MTRTFAPVALVALAVVLSGCPAPPASFLVLTPEQAQRHGQWGCDPQYPRRYYRACSPDSLNVLVAHPSVDAVRVETVAGDVVNQRSVLLRRDSVVYDTGGIPLSRVRFILLRDKPTLVDRLQVAGITAVVGAGLAVLPATSRDRSGEAAESAAIGGAVGFAVGLRLGGVDKHRERFWVGDSPWSRPSREAGSE